MAKIVANMTAFGQYVGGIVPGGVKRSAHDEKRKAAILSQIDLSLKCGEIMKRVIVYPRP